MTSITYYGQSCFLIDAGGKKILFDPFITGNEKAAHIDISTIHPDIICLTHGHQDHTMDAAPIAKHSGATLVANFEVGQFFASKQGVQKVHMMNHGGAHDFGGVKIKYVNAVHTSSNLDGSYGGNPGGYVVSAGDVTFYHSGDTALTYDMKLIGEAYKLDFAMLCIGDNYTMGVDDAIKAAGFIGCDNIIGMHFDTFPEISIDHAAAIAAFKNAGKRLSLMDIGQTSAF